MSTIIPEEDISIATLHALLERAFFRARVDEDGEMYPRADKHCRPTDPVLDIILWIFT